MDLYTKCVISLSIVLAHILLLIMCIYISGLRASRDLIEQELQITRKATLFLLDDLYGDYLGELQYLSIDPGFYRGGGKRIEYLREQLQEIEGFVNTLDPERKAFDKGEK